MIRVRLSATVGVAALASTLASGPVRTSWWVDEGPATSSVASASAAGASGAYRVEGNRVLGPGNAPFVVHGVARPSLEWSCQGQALDGSGGIPASEAIAMRDVWGANTVRFGLNESYWLGSAGLQKSNTCPDYVSTVTAAVAAARAAGLVVILDLHWSEANDPSRPAAQHCAPGRNSAAFWGSVAETYRDDSAVWFEAYNEPHDVSWAVWRDGGWVACPDGTTYDALGMQDLVDAIRGSGAENIVVVNGLDWAYDLSGIPTWHPTGSNLVYGTHPYAFKAPASDWARAFSGMAAFAPVIATEFGRTTCDAVDPYDTEILNFFRRHGIGYTAWAWWAGDCGFPSLLADASAACTRGGCAVQADLIGLATGRLAVTFPKGQAFPGDSRRGWRSAVLVGLSILLLLSLARAVRGLATRYKRPRGDR